MNAHPILFSSPMIRAILEGRKTQTRRIYKPRCVDAVDDPLGPLFALPSPCGSPGDRMWVKETWGLRVPFDETDWFRASAKELTKIPDGFKLEYRADWGPMQEGCFWRPSIFMYRWASRITLEVTDVRVQRLQEISEDDAQAEGCNRNDAAIVFQEGKQGFDRDLSWTARGAFACLWDSINAKRATWASNPFVWAYTFRRIP